MKNKFNFTKASIDTLPIPGLGKRAVYHNTKVSALQLRVTGVKTFFINRRIKGGDPQRFTLGRYPGMKIDQARRKAMKIVHFIAEGKNPAGIKREAKKK